jgi:hypothetical protein
MIITTVHHSLNICLLRRRVRDNTVVVAIVGIVLNTWTDDAKILDCCDDATIDRPSL